MNKFFLKPTPKFKIRLVWLSLAVVFWILARLTHFLPFTPSIPRWSLKEDYKQGAVPHGGVVRQSHSSRSDSGLLIGVDGPGFVEWMFSRPGPFPVVVQSFFVPADGQTARVMLRTPSHPEPRVLFENMPLRNRPFDLSRYVAHDKAFALRFEGTAARLEELRFFEPSENAPVPWVILFATVLIAGFFLRNGNQSALVILAFTLLGFYFRWDAFRTFYSLPLEGDAVDYWSLVQHFQWRQPFMTGPREPGFIWVASAARWLFGDSVRSLRFLGILMSTLCVPLTAAVAGAAGWPFWVGAGAALMVATNPFAIFMSVQGYQLEFFMVLILLFSMGWVKNQPKKMAWTGALLCITRVQSFFAVIPLALLRDWLSWRGKRNRVLFWTPYLLLSFVFLAAVYRQPGSCLAHFNRVAVFYENIEAKDAGRPPEVKPATLGSFLSARGRLAALVKGYVKILFDPRDPYNRILLNSHYARAWNLIFYPFFWIGFFVCLKDRNERGFLWLPLLFLSGLPMFHDLLREPRLLFHVQPFFALLVAKGAWVAFRPIFSRPIRPT